MLRGDANAGNAGFGAPFGFGGPVPVHDMPTRINECKEQWQNTTVTRANQAKQCSRVLCHAREEAIDRQADHDINVHIARTNARRQAAKLQVQNHQQQQNAMIDRQAMVANTTLEQRAQQAETFARQRINAVEHQAQQQLLARECAAAHSSALAGHAANVAGIHQQAYGPGYGYGNMSGYRGLGSYGGCGGYSGLGGGMGAYGGYGRTGLE